MYASHPVQTGAGTLHAHHTKEGRLAVSLVLEAAVGNQAGLLVLDLCSSLSQRAEVPLSAGEIILGQTLQFAGREGEHGGLASGVGGGPPSPWGLVGAEGARLCT